VNSTLEAIGDRWLCAWKVSDGECRIQTRLPRHARRLTQRTDTRLVAREHASPYLRVFAINRPLAFVENLLRRYTAKHTATNEAFGDVTHGLESVSSGKGKQV
jgi:hypothetical protein